MMYQKRNNIQQILLFSIFAILLILCITFLLTFFIKQKQSEVFKETGKSELGRSIDLFADVKESVLKNALVDYTFWDEMVNFIHKPSKEWSELNIVPTLNTFKFEAAWVFDTANNIIYSTYNSKYPVLNKFPEEVDIFKELYHKRYIHSFHKSDSLLIEIMGSTVHPSFDAERITSPQGFVFFARVWDKAFLKEFADVTSTQIKLISKIPSNDPESKPTIRIYKPLLNYNDNTVAYLGIDKKINSWSLFNSLSRIFVIVLLIASISILAILLYTSARYIKKPLTIIEEALKNNNIEKTKELNRYTSEFAQIGSLIRNFIEQKSELEKAKIKAEESEKLKSAFLANMSHEIRSPLNGIIGFSELLAELETDEKTKKFANYINIRSNDLLRIINDILDFSRLEAQQLEVINQKFNIHPLMDELEEMYRISDFTEKNIQIRFIKGSDVELYSDILRVKQILINLIDNALKFTENGTVEIGYEISTTDLKFYVKDTGIGISEEKIDIIFDRFRQINENPSSRQGGNGLGLAICKGLSILMNGNIRVESKENYGSTFYFSLPLNSK